MPTARATPLPTEAPGWPENKDEGHLESATMAPELSRVASCGPSAELRPGGVGPLEVGMSVPEVLANCPGALRIWEFEEGVAYPSMAVRLGGALFIASFVDASPTTPSYRISTKDALAKTAEGLGPRSPLGALKAAFGQPTFEIAECGIFALFDSHPGMAWALAFPANWTCDDLGGLSKAGGRRPPDSVPVVSVRLVPRKGA